LLKGKGFKARENGRWKPRTLVRGSGLLSPRKRPNIGIEGFSPGGCEANRTTGGFLKENLPLFNATEEDR
jgi:hypothetical protein